jgi:chromosomal replication initiator protein
MARVDHDLRDSILSELADLVDPKTFGTWFKKLEFERIDDDNFFIPVPNVFYRDVIERKFRAVIEEAFSNTFGYLPTIDFKVESQQELPIEWPSIDEPAPSETAPVETVRVPVEPVNSAIQAPAGFTSSSLHLNDQYTFDNFVSGPSNRLAHAGALAVAEQPGNTYNPLFIHGNVGLGKTHLLQALCHRVLDHTPSTSILYVSCEDFVNDYISAVQRGNLETFRSLFRSYDLLVIDDIHFLANKEGSQEEFFHTFNALHNANKQLVLSSDSSPKEIPTLKERLVSRFSWGLVAQIDPPTFETRIAILRNKLEQREKEVSDDVLQYIAMNIDSNIRELEGAIIKLIGFASLTDREITLDLARETLKDAIEVRRSPVTVHQIQEKVCEYHGIRLEDLQSKKRSKSISVPRQIGIYLSRELTNHSLSEIGAFFGGKDHTTIMYSVNKVKEQMTGDSELRATIDYLTRELTSR